MGSVGGAQWCLASSISAPGTVICENGVRMQGLQIIMLTCLIVEGIDDFRVFVDGIWYAVGYHLLTICPSLACVVVVHIRVSLHLEPRDGQPTENKPYFGTS